MQGIMNSCWFRTPRCWSLSNTPNFDGHILLRFFQIRLSKTVHFNYLHLKTVVWVYQLCQHENTLLIRKLPYLWSRPLNSNFSSLIYINTCEYEMLLLLQVNAVLSSINKDPKQIHYFLYVGSILWVKSSFNEAN